eukprot:TRINITY_DN3730_c0_g1_i1.p1 TRINITY_DN3730_c0_g1~~TRINITY_DN3730_c0_g1_i1.p1  ORF type:complete len:364 (-),score=109.29 TRINITY_DN3730_c0_g1_i1:31-1122(-)
MLAAVLRGTHGSALRVHSTPCVQAFVQKRGIKKSKATRKPFIRFQTKPDGTINEPTAIRGYDPDEVARYNKWLKKAVVRVSRSMGASSGDRFLENMNKEIKHYIETDWGIKASILKAEARRKRSIRIKRKRGKQLWKKMAEWNKMEDIQEQKVLRDKQRKQAVENKEVFSFSKFLKQQREKKKTPYTILPEDEFQALIQKKLNTEYFWGPKSARVNRGNRHVGYYRKYVEDIYDPWEYELKRRGMVQEMVDQREMAIAEQKWKDEVAAKREQRLKERQDDFQKHIVHWNKTIGEWHKRNNNLRLLKAEYMNERAKALSLARREFLQALNDDEWKWTESPAECRFLRFRFAEGVQFPYNKSSYI